MKSLLTILLLSGLVSGAKADLIDQNTNPLNLPGPHKITVEANFTTLSGNLACNEDVSNIINRRLTLENAICFQDIDYKFRAPDFFQVTIWDSEGDMPQTKIYNRGSLVIESPKKLSLVFHIVTPQMSPERLGFNFGPAYGAKGSSRNLWHFRILVDGQVIHNFIKGNAHENAGIMRLQ